MLRWSVGDARQQGAWITDPAMLAAGHAVLLDVKDIPQVGPLQWGRITKAVAKRLLKAERGGSFWDPLNYDPYRLI
jgi:hypothetical protein